MCTYFTAYEYIIYFCLCSTQAIFTNKSDKLMSVHVFFQQTLLSERYITVTVTLLTHAYNISECSLRMWRGRHQVKSPDTCLANHHAHCTAYTDPSSYVQNNSDVGMDAQRKLSKLWLVAEYKIYKHSIIKLKWWVKKSTNTFTIS